MKSSQVSEDEIEQSYKKLSDKYNPAFNPDPENLVRFKKIQEAYECVKIFTCRVQYKKFGSYIQSMMVTNEDNK